VIFWIDAQLPPGLAPWLCERFVVDAQSLRFLGLHGAEDAAVFAHAKAVGDVVLISKDSDFVDLILRQGAPPRLLWVTCGNLTNRRLREVFADAFPSALQHLQAGKSIVEIGDARPV